jgi:hypothetical protein
MFSAELQQVIPFCVLSHGWEACYRNEHCAFPTKNSRSINWQKILEGCQALSKEAGFPLLGGHRVDDPEMKYGLSVTGLCILIKF